MNHDDIVETLNDLIATCKDGEFGFDACAEHVLSAELKRVFTQRAFDCRRAADELQGLVAEYGGTPQTHGSASGALHRGWAAVRGSLVGYSDHAILEECERGEDSALARYRAALRDDALPEAVRAVVVRQQLGAQNNHDEIKRLRDMAKAA